LPSQLLDVVETMEEPLGKIEPPEPFGGIVLTGPPCPGIARPYPPHQVLWGVDVDPSEVEMEAHHLPLLYALIRPKTRRCCCRGERSAVRRSKPNLVYPRYLKRRRGVTRLKQTDLGRSRLTNGRNL
jgi:hypothetical protein